MVRRAGIAARLAAAALLATAAAAALPPAAARADEGAAPARADTVAALEHRLELGADGDGRLVITAVLGAGGPAVLLLPFGHAEARVLDVAGPVVPSPGSGERALVHETGGRHLLALDLAPTAAAGDTLRVTCSLVQAVDWSGPRAPFGARDLSQRFVNDTELSIGAFRLTLALPASHRIRSVTGSEPAFKPQVSPEPPYTLRRVGDHDEVSLVASPLRPGGRTHLGLVAERAARGPVPLAAGACLAALYLFAFRDLIRRPRRPGAGSSNQEDQA